MSSCTPDLRASSDTTDEPIIVGRIGPAETDESALPAGAGFRWIKRPTADYEGLGLVEFDVADGRAERRIVTYVSAADPQTSIWVMYRDEDDDDAVHLTYLAGCGIGSPTCHACDDHYDCDCVHGRALHALFTQSGPNVDPDDADGEPEPKTLDLPRWEGDDADLSAHPAEPAALAWCENFRREYGQPPWTGDFLAAFPYGSPRVYARMLRRGHIVEPPKTE